MQEQDNSLSQAVLVQNRHGFTGGIGAGEFLVLTIEMRLVERPGIKGSIHQVQETVRQNVFMRLVKTHNFSPQKKPGEGNNDEIVKNFNFMSFRPEGEILSLATSCKHTDFSRWWK